MPFAGLASKSMNDPSGFCDLHPDLLGQLKKGDAILNSTKVATSALAA